MCALHSDERGCASVQEDSLTHTNLHTAPKERELAHGCRRSRSRGSCAIEADRKPWEASKSPAREIAQEGTHPGRKIDVLVHAIGFAPRSCFDRPILFVEDADIIMGGASDLQTSPQPLA